MWFRDFIREDGSLNHAALDRAPDHVKPIVETWKRAKNFEDIAVQHTNSNFLNGKKALAPLPDGAPPEVVAERRKLLESINGVPSDPKGYGIQRPPELPENLWSEPAAQNLAKWAHENCVSPQAAQKLMSEHAKIIMAQAAEIQQGETKFWNDQQSAFEAQIRQDNIPAEKASALVEKGAIALGLDPTNEQTKIFLKGKDARLMAMRHAIAIGEDSAVTANTTGQGQQDPQAAADDILRNPQNPMYSAFWQKKGESSAAHNAAVQRRNELLQLAAAKQKK